MHHTLALFRLLAANGSYDTAIQVIGKDDAVELFERALDSLGLLDDVNAVRIILNHPLDSAHMAFNRFEPVYELLFFISHRYLPPIPPPRGDGRSILDDRALVKMPLANLRSAGFCHPGVGARAAKAERRVRDRGISASQAATRMKFNAAAINRCTNRVFASRMYRERRRSLIRVP